MDNNTCAPSLSPPSKNGPMGNNSTSFSNLFNDSIVVGFNRSPLSFANTNGTDRLSPLLSRPSSPPSPPPPSPPPSPILVIPSESDVTPHELNQQMQPQFDAVTFAKRPRGRPPGSKNKPKPAMELPIPTTILQEREDFFKPIILIVPAGMDIVNAIINFSRNRDVSISVHHALGTISEVSLRNPFSPFDDLSFRENLLMSSFSGFYTNNLSSSPPNNIPYSSFTIQLSRGMTPQLFGGLVGAKLIAAEPVHVMASIIKKHEYHRMVHPITNSNIQLVTESTHTNHRASIMRNAISGTTNNTTNHPGFSVGASTSSTMNVQPLTAPTNVNMLYWNNPTNQGNNY